MSPSTDSPRRLSVVLVAHCDADLLPASCESVEPIADEIIVVYTGVDSEAVAAAAARGAIRVEHAWDDDFAAAKNAGLAKCSGDWVLFLEPGEVFAPDNADMLRGFIETTEPNDTAFVMLVRTAASTGVLAAEQVAEIRLAPGGRGLTFQQRVRENLRESLAAENIGVEILPILLLRDEVDASERKNIRAQLRLELADLEIKVAGPQSELLNCLGDAFQTLNDPQTAARFFQRTISQTAVGSEPPPERLEAFYGLLSVLDQTGQPRSELIRLCSQALESFPLDMQLLCALGGYLQTKGHLEHACRSYRLAYEHGQINPYLGHLAELHEIAANCVATVLQMTQKEDEAETLLEEALEDSPGSLRLRRQLLEILVKQGRLEDAVAHVNSPLAKWPNAAALKSTVRGACLAVQKNWTAAVAHLEAAYNTGYRDPLCLRFYVRGLLERERPAEATAVLEAWQKIGRMPSAAEDLLHRLQAGDAELDTADTTDEKPMAPRLVRIDDEMESTPPVVSANKRTAEEKKTT